MSAQRICYFCKKYEELNKHKGRCMCQHVKEIYVQWDKDASECDHWEYYKDESRISETE